MFALQAVLLLGFTIVGLKATQVIICSQDNNIDRAGSDMSGMPIPGVASASMCAQKCLGQSGCPAYTFDARPGGTFGNCWLKSTTPAQSPATNVISGACAPIPCTQDTDTDRAGSDMSGMPIPGVTSASICAQKCLGQSGCAAYAFDGRAGSTLGNCWLKSTTLAQTSFPGVISGTCASQPCPTIPTTGTNFATTPLYSDTNVPHGAGSTVNLGCPLGFTHVQTSVDNNLGGSGITGPLPCVNGAFQYNGQPVTNLACKSS